MSHCAEDTPLSHETRVFSEYMEKQFKANIPEEPHHYILVSQVGCKSCIRTLIEEIDPVITIENSPRCTVISSRDDDLVPEKMMERVTFLHDDYGKLDQMNMDISNVTLVVTSGKKVIYIRSFDLEASPSISAVLKEKLR